MNLKKKIKIFLILILNLQEDSHQEFKAEISKRIKAYPWKNKSQE